MKLLVDVNSLKCYCQIKPCYYIKEPERLIILLEPNQQPMVIEIGFLDQKKLVRASPDLNR